MIGVVGSSNMDIVLTVERFTNPGETQKAISLEYFPGGKGANQAVTAAKLSKKDVYFFTALGNDDFGKNLASNFDKLNIKGYIYTDLPTGRAYIEVTKNGCNRIIIFEGANGFITPEIVENKLDVLNEYKYFLLQNEIPFETSLHIAKALKTKKKIIIFDPAPAQNIEKEIFQYVDYFTPNEEEFKYLSNKFFGLNPEEKLKEALRRFFNLGIKNIILKQGEKEIILYNRNSILKIPVFKIENVVDTTAAGDVFNGALAVALEEGKSIKEAIQFASAAAGIAITKKGAQSSIPNREEVDKFLKNNNKG
ncbi:ribokinase [Marinitoga hydrogenitolerans DSM 16785]|uniref:Ribokinase n=1 Tax=Marinitoga hydrogenitolerans (strain DSM 16785 / JCM 12826 / AT1271) TaxID=1122195 RepID=A0A1M4YNS4_MARH1|nr:ribokinase [Marinitoga hydrogenitolerans]SHF07430.1 ribokinase [Marinitoga hydrogenitolerans DSM 16785]